MVEVKCPKCKSRLEISEFKENGCDRIAVFCSKEDCSYHKTPLIGLDRKSSEVYISEAYL